jgi:predicted permease
MAVRTAIGATRSAIVRQLLVESVMVSAAAGVLGILFSLWGTQMLAQLAATTLPRGAEIAVDARVLAFTAAVSIVSGLVFGLIPALRVSRPDLNTVLRSEGRSATAGRRRGTMRGLLVILQVALSTVLLIGSGLLLRNFLQLRLSSPGFEARNVLTMAISLPQARYAGAAKILPFTDELLREVRSVPGVIAAAATSLPVNPSRFTPALPEGQPDVPLSERPIFNLQQITPGYAATLGVPIMRGREYTDRDNAKAPPVVMINQAAARRFFAGQDAVGRHIRVGRIPNPSEIVAVLGDVRNQSLTQDVQPELYVPFAQVASLNINLIVRTVRDPHRLAAAIRARVFQIDPDQPVTRVQTMEELLDAGAAQPRLTTYLLSGLSAAALILALTGIYGVISYSVAERTQEMGIRIALGAEQSEILRLILRQGLGLAAMGIGIGIAASLVLAHFIGTLLYHVSPTDPITYLIAPVLFAAVALAASYLPARRATKVDPVVALRVG